MKKMGIFDNDNVVDQMSLHGINSGNSLKEHAKDESGNSLFKYLREGEKLTLAKKFYFEVIDKIGVSRDVAENICKNYKKELETLSENNTVDSEKVANLLISYLTEVKTINKVEDIPYRLLVTLVNAYETQDDSDEKFNKLPKIESLRKRSFVGNKAQIERLIDSSIEFNKFVEDVYKSDTSNIKLSENEKNSEALYNKFLDNFSSLQECISNEEADKCDGSYNGADRKFKLSDLEPKEDK